MKTAFRFNRLSGSAKQKISVFCGLNPKRRQRRRADIRRHNLNDPRKFNAVQFNGLTFDLVRK